MAQSRKLLWYRAGLGLVVVAALAAAVLLAGPRTGDAQGSGAIGLDVPISFPVNI